MARRNRHPSSRRYLQYVRRRSRAIRQQVREILLRLQSQRADADGFSNAEIEDTASVLFAFADEIEKLRPARVSDRELRRIGVAAALVSSRTQKTALRRAGVALRTISPDAEVVGIPLQLAPDEDVLVDQWAVEGAWYIQREELRLFDDLQQTAREEVAAGIRAGDTWRTIAAKMEQRVSVGRSRLEFIARDQVSTLNGRITEHLQKKAGVTHYISRSSHDSRVRPACKAADGKRFAWSSGGAPGRGYNGEPAHPGQGPNCRCTAEPVLDD